MGGRGDQRNNGNTVEFLPFNPSKGSPTWKELPYLQKPHPNMPGVSYMEGSLFVIAGGGPPFPGGEKTVIFYSILFIAYWNNNGYNIINQNHLRFIMMSIYHLD